MSPVRLQVTVMIAAFVVATISPSVAYETLPPSTTTLPMTTASSTTGICLWEGSQVEGLTPGSRVHANCMYYECDELGMVMAYPDECGMGPLMCVDSEPGECCPTCPNGYNCRTPSGKIIKNGETVTENGMTCSCYLSDYWWEQPDRDWNWNGGQEAECSGVTTTPTPTPTRPPTTRKRRSPEERERWRKIRRLKKKLSKFQYTLPIKEKRKLKRRLRRLQSQE